MKYIFILIVLTCANYCYGQTTLKAKDAIAHIGETILLQDSILSAKIFKDSIAVLELGELENPNHVNVTIISKIPGKKIDQKIINGLKFGKASFKGVLLPTLNGVQLIIDNPRNISLSYNKL